MNMTDRRMQVIVDKTIDDYLEFANNAFAVRNAPPVTFQLVKDVDQLIREVWSAPIEADAIPSFLSMNAYYYFMASVRMALAGHVASIFPLTRAALESACYAFLMTRDKSLVSVWADREKGEVERKACRKAFSSAVSDATRRLRMVQVEAADFIRDLYDASITYGAHPNVLGLFKHADVPADEGHQWRVPFTCMYDSTSYEVAHALFICAEFGIGVAYLNSRCISDHPLFKELQTRFDAVLQSKHLMEDRLKNGNWAA